MSALLVAVNYVSLFLACFYTFCFIHCVISMMSYSDLDQLCDTLNEQRRTSHPHHPFLIAGIFWCVAFATM